MKNKSHNDDVYGGGLSLCVDDSGDETQNGKSERHRKCISYVGHRKTYLSEVFVSCEIPGCS